MRRAAQVGAVTLVLALLGLLVWDLVRTEGGDIAAKADKNIVVAAPDFTRPRVDTTGELTLSSLRGKVVVMNFWQSYCPPCTEEAPTLVKSYENWKDKGVAFVGIDVQDLRGPAQAFLKRFKITYPNVADGGNLVGRYGVTGYPETFFLTAKGCVVSPHIVGPASHENLNEGIRRAKRMSAESCGTET
jgi:cytochrome c biogenesis protein CcmG/thiol:disulfide interchange protein DsbE